MPWGSKESLQEGRKGKSSPLGIFHITQNCNTKQATLTVVGWPDDSPEFSHYHLELQVPLLDTPCKS